MKQITDEQFQAAVESTKKYFQQTDFEQIMSDFGLKSEDFLNTDETEKDCEKTQRKQHIKVATPPPVKKVLKKPRIFPRGVLAVK